jgi:hypothetical protein
MISGRDLKNVLTQSFTNGTSFLAPTASFIATPSTYTVSSLPASVILSGTITPNNGTLITWTITNSGGTVIATGSGVNVTHTLASVPSAVSTNVYNLNVTYTNATAGTTAVIVVATSVVVTAAGKVGQINSPTATITIPGDLTAPYEAALVVETKTQMINLFPIVAANTGRIVIVIPDSYGTVSIIEDGAGLNALPQFNATLDPTNSRTIYSSVNIVTPGTYNYKIIF